MRRFKVDAKEQIAAEVEKHSTKEKRETTASKHKHKIRANQIRMLQKHMPGINSILCIGCRHDSEVAQFHKASKRAVGIDIANETELIRKIDAHELDQHFKPNTFDLVYAAHSLEHMHTPEKVLANIRRVAKKGVFIALPLPHKSGEAVIPSVNHPAIYDVMITDIKPENFNRHPELLKDFEALAPFKLKFARHRYQGDLPKELYMLFKFV